MKTKVRESKFIFDRKCSKILGQIAEWINLYHEFYLKNLILIITIFPKIKYFMQSLLKSTFCVILLPFVNFQIIWKCIASGSEKFVRKNVMNKSFFILTLHLHFSVGKKASKIPIDYVKNYSKVEFTQLNENWKL